jgi:hypothetical protein
MQRPRDYYPPEYLAEVQAREQREKQNAIKKQWRRRVREVTVRRLPSGCLLYQLHSDAQDGRQRDDRLTSTRP